MPVFNDSAVVYITILLDCGNNIENPSLIA